MQRIMYCVLGMCCATASHADLIRTDAHARWQDENIIISSRLATAQDQLKTTGLTTPSLLLHTPQTLSAATLFDTNSAQLKGTSSLTPIMQELLSNLVYEAIRQRSDLMLHLLPVRRL